MRLREILSPDASVKLFHAEHRGAMIYKALYPRGYIHSLAICAVMLFVNYKLTGFDYFRLYEEMQLPDRFTYYAIGLSALLLLTIVLPWYGLLKVAFGTQPHAVIQMRGVTLSVVEMGRATSRDQRTKIDVELTRADIIAVSANVAGRGTWKIAKMMNCLQIRTRDKVLKCFYGMNGDHLETVKNALLTFV